MAIKSKKWYERQILALENAVKNTSNLASPVTEYMSPETREESYKSNVPVYNKVKMLQTELNRLKDEFNLYYR